MKRFVILFLVVMTLTGCQNNNSVAVKNATIQDIKKELHLFVGLRGYSIVFEKDFESSTYFRIVPSEGYILTKGKDSVKISDEGFSTEYEDIYSKHPNRGAKDWAFIVQMRQVHGDVFINYTADSSASDPTVYGNQFVEQLKKDGYKVVLAPMEYI